MTVLTAVVCILALLLPYHILNYDILILCVMIVGYIVIHRVLCYRPGMGLLRIRRLH